MQHQGVRSVGKMNAMMMMVTRSCVMSKMVKNVVVPGVDTVGPLCRGASQAGGGGGSSSSSSTMMVSSSWMHSQPNAGNPTGPQNLWKRDFVSWSLGQLQQQQQEQRQGEGHGRDESGTVRSSNGGGGGNANTTMKEEVKAEEIDTVVERDAGSSQRVTKEQIGLKAQLIFDACWKKMMQRLGDRFVSPREVVWLNGAPGSGKGTNMPFIMKSRGLSRSIGMSQLLDSPEIKSIVDKGELVPDALVLDALLDAILNPELNDGAGLVIDGFPRTATQVDFVKLLYDCLMERHIKNADSPEEWRSPRPSFKVVILYVDEEESVNRQLKRAELASLHNQRVLDAGTGDVWNVRTTDVNAALCRRRYQVFKAHYSTILRLKSYFPFSLIDAMGSLQDCRSQIVRELRYQSSLDLDEKTYAAIRHLPLAKDLVRVARQRLVYRLDLYCKKHYRLFTDIISLIDTEVIPVLKQCSLAGHAEYRSRHPLLLSSPLAVDMLIDILTDRGFSVAHFLEERVVPWRMDTRTGEISNHIEDIHSFRITFDKENIRDIASVSSTQPNMPVYGENLAIGTTFVPEHMRRGNDPNIVGTAASSLGASMTSTTTASEHSNRSHADSIVRHSPSSSGKLSCFVSGEHRLKEASADEHRRVRVTSRSQEGLMKLSNRKSIPQGSLAPTRKASERKKYGYDRMNERED